MKWLKISALFLGRPLLPIVCRRIRSSGQLAFVFVFLFVSFWKRAEAMNGTRLVSCYRWLSDQRADQLVLLILVLALTVKFTLFDDRTQGETAEQHLSSKTTTLNQLNHVQFSDMEKGIHLGLSWVRHSLPCFAVAYQSHKNKF